MPKKPDLNYRLKEAIQAAIFEVGEIEASNQVVLMNTDVTAALLEVLGVWASSHSFDTYTRLDLILKYAEIIEEHIEYYQPILKSGKLPINIIPRNKVH